MSYIFEPVPSQFAQSNIVTDIQNELKTFGLNPSDWRPDTTSHQRSAGLRAQLILVHREDHEIRIVVDFSPVMLQSERIAILGVAFLMV